MSLDSNPATDTPLRPPEPPEPAGLWRWAVAAALVVVIVVGAFKAYAWLVSDVERRRAVAEAPSAPPSQAHAQAPAQEPPAQSPPAPVGRTVGPAQPGAPLSEGLAAPAVTGQAIYKCEVEGQVTYTNHPCPEGADSQVPPAEGTDPNGVIGSAGDQVPVAPAARPVALSAGDPSQQAASCAYLTAEIARLDFEFKQPLPPNVLDHISSQLSGLRAQHTATGCAPLPQAAASKRPPTKVVEEKRGD